MTSPRAYRALYAYTWDLAESDPGALDQEFARAGLNTITIAAAYHAGKFTRPHGKSGKVYFPEDGVLHCQIDDAKFGAIKPEIGKLAQENNVFADFCQNSALDVTAWAVLMHNSRIGAQHPDCITRNAFGDGLIYSLCPSSPAARDYAVTLCTQLAAQYDIKGLSIETPGWLPFRHGYHHEFALIGESPRAELYLGLCFCANCKSDAKLAGIDVENLQTRVMARVNESLSADAEPFAPTDRQWLETELLFDADLAAFMRWRCTVVTSLIAQIRAEVRKDAAVHVIPSVNQPLALSWIEGTDLAAVDRAADGLEVCFYAPADRVMTDVAAVKRQIGHSDMRVVLRPTSPEHRSEGSFAGTIKTMADSGIRDFGFYNYGHMRRAGVERIGRSLGAIEPRAVLTGESE
ncbi:hypothetical protein [Ketogulonicigenium vulgare]|uniref:hypothetical protein n=1 Tax=Ketogulonicigenium vulgare TaxID=92945 RepID=UPI002358DC18|nr:hypothetical protein [Ketogulonicigenium vulgare]